jgi:hypothetical protein
VGNARATKQSSAESVGQVGVFVPYLLKLIAYFLAFALVVGVISNLLTPLGAVVNAVLAVIAGYLAVVVGRWLFGRKSLQITAPCQ